MDCEHGLTSPKACLEAQATPEASIVPAIPEECTWPSGRGRWAGGKGVSLLERESTMMSSEASEEAELTTVWPRWILSFYLGNSKIRGDGI